MKHYDLGTGSQCFILQTRVVSTTPLRLLSKATLNLLAFCVPSPTLT
jgi:hypothetical protein